LGRGNCVGDRGMPCAEILIFLLFELVVEIVLLLNIRYDFDSLKQIGLLSHYIRVEIQIIKSTNWLGHFVT
jgi:hypothetical protein